MKKLANLLILLFLSSFVFSQATSIKRIEVESTKDFDVFGFIPFGDLGVLQDCYSKSKDKADKKNSIYTYTKYNTELEQVKSIDLKRPKDYPWTKTTYTNDQLFELYYNKKGEYIIYKVDIKTMTPQPFTGIFPKNLDNLSIEVSGNFLYLYGTIKHRPFLLIKNLTTGVDKIVKTTLASKNKRATISFTKNDKSGEIFLFYNDVVADKNVVKMYAFNGDKTVLDIALPNIDGKYIDDASASKTSDGAYIITGTYKKTVKTLTSIGMFILKVNDKKIVYKKYINYLDINNFTAHLTQRMQDKIDKKRDKKADKGKELEINYRIATHDIIEDNGTYILVGEAYYPTYRTECTTTTVNGQTTQTCKQVFDGYEYTHYFAYAFDENGNRVWSNSEAMYINYKPFRVIRFCTLNLDNKVLSVVYASGTEIITTTFQNGLKLNSSKSTYLKTDNEADKIRYSSAHTNYWYGNYYIVNGWQKIKDKESKEKRKVYYLNKIQYK